MNHLQRAFGSKLARIVVSLMAIPMILACTCTGSIPALPGSKSTPTLASGGKMPSTVAPSPGKPTATRASSSASSDIPPGNFSYEVSNAGPDDKKIDSGVIQDQSTTAEYVIGLMEKGALARYAVTLFLPLDIGPGKIDLKPLDPKAFKKGPNLSIFIGSANYYGTGGTLTIDSLAEGKISGSFQFTAKHESDASRTVTVKGAFNQVPLGKGAVSAVGTRPTQPTTQPPGATKPPAVQPTATTGGASGGGELRQWATAARASSYYGGGSSWSPDKATGAPDVPGCADDGRGWASESDDTVEWLELTYATPVHVSLVRIIQNYNPTQIVKAELIEPNGTAHTVYSEKPKKAPGCPQTLNISFEKTSYLVNRVKITIDQSALGLGWNEIDAVELIGVK